MVLHDNKTMSSQNGLNYESLPHACEYLRILTVHAGHVSESIRCTLRTVSFHDKPSYDTLSYTWGDSTVTKPIEVDGVVIEVTTHLEQALRHMRDAETDLVLWVDAICINQTDLREKSHQVALMGQIYSECAQVRIWLGCDIPKCRLKRSSLPVENGGIDNVEEVDPFGIIRILATGRHIHEWSCFQTQDDTEPGKILYKASDEFNMMWEGLLAVDESQWWTRMWTVQEAILPMKGLVHFDTWQTSLETITDCGQCYRKYAFSTCCQDALSHLPLALHTLLEQFCVAADQLDTDRKRNETGDLQLNDFETQHLVYGSRGCKDPRDKIYGLLGIMKDQFITPDYNVSKEQVFFQATCYLLCCGENNLQNLVGPHYGPAPGKWASWVRDFDAPFDRLLFSITETRYLLMDHHIYDASGTYDENDVLPRTSPRPAVEIEEQEGQAILGRCVGKVTFVSGDIAQSELRDIYSESQRHVFQQWMLQVLNWAAVDISARANAPSEAHEDADRVLTFWRTLLGDIAFPVGESGNVKEDYKNFTPATIHWLEHFLSWVVDKDRVLNHELGDLISIATHGRCYFKAENNGQGLCYPHARVGDEIWVLDGGKVPFVLRPAHLDQEERYALISKDADGFGFDEIDVSSGSQEFGKPIERYHEFIGDCYFDGYMHGEAVRDSTLHKQSIMLV